MMNRWTDDGKDWCAEQKSVALSLQFLITPLSVVWSACLYVGKCVHVVSVNTETEESNSRIRGVKWYSAMIQWNVALSSVHGNCGSSTKRYRDVLTTYNQCARTTLHCSYHFVQHTKQSSRTIPGVYYNISVRQKKMLQPQNISVSTTLRIQHEHLIFVSSSFSVCNRPFETEPRVHNFSTQLSV